jgi:ubiquinone/menaquinone biosynthesis C-methylase UbiE
VIGRALQSVKLRVLDGVDAVRHRDPLVPPRRLDFVGDSDFRATGDEFLRLFVDTAGLKPDERVLDVGSGIGRMARPLARYLRPPGGYEGFDVVPDGVAWCQDRYAAAHPHFRFQLAEVHNGLYRPHAGVPASEYTFPYPDASFDFAFATSVFTHLLPDEADRYLSEMARVTRPGGRLLLTFFLLVAGGRDRGAQRGLTFEHDHGHFATNSEDVPEDAVAYAEDWVRERLSAHRLAPVEPILPGTWSGRADGVSFQDSVIAVPAGGTRPS